MLHKIT